MFILSYNNMAPQKNLKELTNDQLKRKVIALQKSVGKEYIPRTSGLTKSEMIRIINRFSSGSVKRKSSSRKIIYKRSSVSKKGSSKSLPRKRGVTDEEIKDQMKELRRFMIVNEYDDEYDKGLMLDDLNTNILREHLKNVFGKVNLTDAQIKRELMFNRKRIKEIKFTINMFLKGLYKKDKGLFGFIEINKPMKAGIFTVYQKEYDFDVINEEILNKIGELMRNLKLDMICDDKIQRCFYFIRPEELRELSKKMIYNFKKNLGMNININIQ